jgi:polysaccharide biosynthesis/export protein
LATLLEDEEIAAIAKIGPRISDQYSFFIAYSHCDHGGGRGSVRLLRVVLGVLFLGSLLVAGGCSLMPTSGPATADIRAGQRDPKSLPYALVRVTPEVVDILALAVPRLSTDFADRRPAKQIRFGIGDILSVTIFEAAAGGLFIPLEAGVRPGNFITIPPQAVDINGNISIPYAGTIRARGRTQVELQDAIVEALKNRAISPQVVVSLVEARSSLISVLGDVRAPSRYPANPAGERVLDVISRAGGPASPGHEEWVMLERNGRRALTPFGALVYEPANNIFISANDTIYLYREPQTYTVFGAIGAVGSTNNGQLPFEGWRLSLAEAVGKAGGLNESLADPASVYLYRGESREVAEQLKIDCSKFSGPVIPVIYNINFRDPAAYFLATKFEMRNKDVIYVSNAVSVEVTKFLTYLRTINGTIQDPINTAITALTLKGLLQGSASAQPAVLVGSPSISLH